LKVVLDTCVLKLATLPNLVNPAALIVELCLAELIRVWASSSMIEEYQEVLTEYQGVKVLTPGTFVNLPAVQKLVRKHLGEA